MPEPDPILATALARELPRGRGSKPFKLAGRLMKTHRHLDGAGLLLKLQEVEEWQAASNLPLWWERFIDTDYANRSAFLDELLLHCWEVRKFAEGENRISQAVEQARAEPLTGNREINPTGSEGLNLFLSVLRVVALQPDQDEDGNRHQRILPCDELARFMECSGKAVSRYRKRLERHGVLRVLQAHVEPEPGRKGKATVFSVNLQRLRELVEDWPADPEGEAVTEARVVFVEGDDAAFNEAVRELERVKYGNRRPEGHRPPDQQ